MRGRVGVTLDNLGGVAAGRLSGGFISGSVIGSTGGIDGVTLAVANLPSHQHAVFLKDNGHSHGPGSPGTNFITDGGAVENYAAGGGVLRGNPATTSVNPSGLTVGSVSGTANDNQTAATGSGTAVGVLQPSIMVTKLLVVE
jgi:microcystin-dependent protein